MNLLIDSHILLWAALDDPRLRGPMRSVFANGGIGLVVSVATLWEVSIKYSLGKLPLPVAPADFLRARGRNPRLSGAGRETGTRREACGIALSGQWTPRPF